MNIFDNQNNLLNVLEHKIDQFFNRRREDGGFYMTHMTELSQRDVANQSFRYQYYKMFKNILTNMLDIYDEQAKSDMIITCRKYYESLSNIP
ncbi:unnamed protein product, partial [Didymodactylos carnosus]